MTIRDDIKSYLTNPNTVALAQSTQNAYGYSLQHLKKFCAYKGIKSFDNFQPNMPLFAGWLKRSRKMTDQSIQQNITNVKIFLTWLKKPVEYTFKISNHDRQAKKIKHSKRWLSQAEVEKCLAYRFQISTKKNQLKYQLIVRLLVETGCRVKELACLKAEDVDIDERILYLSDSKTEPRPAFFSPESQGLFLKLKSIIPWQGKLFPSVERIKQVVSDMMAELGLKNGQDGRGPHTFRHYAASHLFFVGKLSIEEIAILMGDTVQTIQDVYLHCPIDILQERISVAWEWGNNGL